MELYEQGGFGELFYSEVDYYHDNDLEKMINNPKPLYYNRDSTADVVTRHNRVVECGVEEGATAVSCGGRELEWQFVEFVRRHTPKHVTGNCL